MKRLILCLVFLSAISLSFSQEKSGWGLLTDISFDTEYSEVEEEYFMVPQFSDAVKARDGKEYASAIGS